MEIEFKITDEEAQHAKAFFENWSTHPFVITRHQRNVEGLHDAVTKEEFWEALLSALLTTRQRAGPHNPVTRFIRTTPFPLNLQECLSTQNCVAFINSCITSFGGTRRAPSIAEEASWNLAWLKQGGWRQLFKQITNPNRTASTLWERSSARFLAYHLYGIGPKQSRNILQMLGLSRFEVPLDSRITKWLNSFGFPIRLNAASLSDEAYYEFVSDGFQALCERAQVLPCLMDAAIFVSFDRSSYDEEVMRW